MTLPRLGSLKLRGRLTLYVTLMSVVPLLAISLLETTGARRMMEQQIHATLQVEAEGLKDLVEISLAEREASVRSWTEDSIIRGALLSQDYGGADTVLANLQRRYVTFSGIVLFTDYGQAVSASTPALRDSYAGLEEQVRQAPWFRAALEGRLTAETVMTEDPIFGARVLPLAVAVVSPSDGRPLGVLLAAFDWGQLGEVVKPALARARARSLQSFALEVRRQDGTLLFDSRGDTAHDDTGVVAVTAVNGVDLKDVGDGWHFVAQVSPAEAYASVENLRLLALAITLLFCVLAIAGSYLMARQIARPITALSHVVGRVVQQGDLTQEFNVKAQQDEVGELVEGFRRMLAQLRETATSLQRGTHVLSDTVAELTRAAQQQESNVSRQAAALQETQVTAQEIKQTSLLASEKADAVLTVASRAEDIGRSGEKAIAESLSTFKRLSEQVAEFSQRISQLNERMQQIGGITQTVKELADQSNMLALNAAIEAVRSGEHGKGFSVVAREIRSLADQSIEATNRVRDILNDISQAMLATAKSSEEGQARMEASLGQVRASGENLQQLVTIVQDNASAVRQIAGAVSQQNAGIAQIFSAVTDLSGMMNDTLGSLQATNKATAALQEVAGQMQQTASSYKV
jgi:methyl-accepting chemotaxis protein